MTTPHPTAIKRCRKCGVIKPITDFGVESRRPDGHRFRCKDCENGYARSCRLAARDQGAHVMTWRDVSGYEGRYRVDADGGVWSLLCHGGPRKVLKRLKHKADKRGRHFVNLCDGRGGVRRASVHRLVLEAFVGPCPDGMECCHYDDDQTNNNIDNLRWDTHGANVADRIRNGKFPSGERNSQAKFTEINVRTIRAELTRGVSQRELGRRFGVSPPTIADIAHRRTWRTCGGRIETREVMQ
jgi:hypothetical protein